MVLTTATHRPRNINSIRAGAILYGDWGTSKAYVVGLAFALAGYASFWLLLAVSLLSILIGINYITICKYYPNGGGVYASVRHRSPVLSMIGAFFLIADYLVTAALSALSAAYYFGLPHTVIFAMIAIGLVGLLNFYGPKHMGTVAFGIVVVGFIVLTFLAFTTIPFLKTAYHHIEPLRGPKLEVWRHFVGVIVALSGIEAIANATGIMKLDPGSTLRHPSVKKTSAKAILYVMIEVAIYTTLFGFALAAISGFEFKDGNVNAPGNPGVRDYMLRYMGETFSGVLFGPHFAHAFGIIVSIAIGFLLLSAVNTAFTGLVALQYLMASDGEFPKQFQKLNRYGVPVFPLIIVTIVPIILIGVIRDVEGLAALYAIGFVGAIGTNLCSTSTDRKLPLKWRERIFMFFGFLIMLAVEITLFIDKPHARNYAVAVLLMGLILRGLAKEFKLKKVSEKEVPLPIQAPIPKMEKLQAPAILCPVEGLDKSLDVALEKSKKRRIPLHILFIREQRVISEEDTHRTWESDPDARAVYDHIQQNGESGLVRTYYVVSDSKADIIAAFVMRLEVTQLFIAMPKQGAIQQLVWGNLVRDISEHIPEEIQIYVIP